MIVSVRQLTRADGEDEALYLMMQESPSEENGFLNGARGLSRNAFAAWVCRHADISQGIGLPAGYVRQTIYWMYVDGYPVGSAKLRHDLTDALRIEGGNIGYGIRPTERGKGYGSRLLGLMLTEARRQGLEQVLVTIQNDNIPSLRVATANRGRLEKQTAERSYFWYDLLT